MQCGKRIEKQRGYSHPEKHKSLHWTPLICFFSFKSFAYFASHTLLCSARAHLHPPSSFQTKDNRSLRRNNLAVALRVLEVSVRDTFFCCSCRLAFLQCTAIAVSDASTTCDSDASIHENTDNEEEESGLF